MSPPYRGTSLDSLSVAGGTSETRTWTRHDRLRRLVESIPRRVHHLLPYICMEHVDRFRGSLRVPKTPQHVPIFFFHIISENSPEAWETANSAIQNLKPQKMVGIYSLKIASFHRTWSKIQPKFRQIRPKPQGFRHPKGIPRGFQGDSKGIPVQGRSF